MKRVFIAFALLISLGLTACIKIVVGGKEEEKDTTQTVAVASAEADTSSSNTYTMLDDNPQPSQDKKRNKSETSETLNVDQPAQAPRADGWQNFTMNGTASDNGKTFPIKIKGQMKYTPGGISFKNCKYTNVTLKITFDVTVSDYDGQLSIVCKKDSNILDIEADHTGGNKWTGTMYTRNHAFPITLVIREGLN